jgi:hypothetical protein
MAKRLAKRCRNDSPGQAHLRNHELLRFHPQESVANTLESIGNRSIHLEVRLLMPQRRGRAFRNEIALELGEGRHPGQHHAARETLEQLARPAAA